MSYFRTRVMGGVRCYIHFHEVNGYSFAVLMKRVRPEHGYPINTLGVVVGPPPSHRRGRVLSDFFPVGVRRHLNYSAARCYALVVQDCVEHSSQFPNTPCCSRRARLTVCLLQNVGHGLRGNSRATPLRYDRTPPQRCYTSFEAQHTDRGSDSGKQ